MLAVTWVDIRQVVPAYDRQDNRGTVGQVSKTSNTMPGAIRNRLRGEAPAKAARRREGPFAFLNWQISNISNAILLTKPYEERLALIVILFKIS